MGDFWHNVEYIIIVNENLQCLFYKAFFKK